VTIHPRNSLFLSEGADCEAEIIWETKIAFGRGLCLIVSSFPRGSRKGDETPESNLASRNLNSERWFGIGDLLFSSPCQSLGHLSNPSGSNQIKPNQTSLMIEKMNFSHGLNTDEARKIQIPVLICVSSVFNPWLNHPKKKTCELSPFPQSYGIQLTLWSVHL
jgi:hypothetical protein